MKVEELQTYQEVVQSLRKKGRAKHLLLGNGFSMAYDAKIFSYNALSAFIENSEDELLKQLFNSINTKNFEIIMQQLDLFTCMLDFINQFFVCIENLSNISEKV